MYRLKIDESTAHKLTYWSSDAGVDLNTIIDWRSRDEQLLLAAAILANVACVADEDGEYWHDEVVFQSAVDATEKAATGFIERGEVTAELHDLEIVGTLKDGKLRDDEWSQRRSKRSPPSNESDANLREVI